MNELDYKLMRMCVRVCTVSAAQARAQVWPDKEGGQMRSQVEVSLRI